MEKASELTSTIHLTPLNPPAAPAHLENILSELSPADSSVLHQIIQGDGKSAMIFIHRGPAQGSRFLITEGGASFGRAASNEIFLDDFTVSRKHAAITTANTSEGVTFTFSDLGSLNGSYINGVQKSAHRLQSGDEIQIGKFHMLFIGADKSAGQSAGQSAGNKTGEK